MDWSTSHCYEYRCNSNMLTCVYVLQCVHNCMYSVVFHHVQYLNSVGLCLLYIRTLLVLCGSPPHCTVHVRTLWFSVIVQYMYVLCGSLSLYNTCTYSVVFCHCTVHVLTLWFSVILQSLYSVVLRSCTVLVLCGSPFLYGTCTRWFSVIVPYPSC